MSILPAAVRPRARLLHHFCCLQMPDLDMAAADSERHLARTFALHRNKNAAAAWDSYLDNLYPLDWFLASACLEGRPRAWERLFAARASRADCLLVDALRARAARLYPGNEERQENAVQEFWGHLFVADTSQGLPVLARYDGLRPLVPWLIRVFQNWHLSQLRRDAGWQSLPEDEAASFPAPENDSRWHEAFRQAARDWLAQLSDQELLLLGLRLRYRLSGREVAQLLGVHEGTISRRTDQLRDRCLEIITQRLHREGWMGEDVSDLIRTEMYPLLLEEPRLSVDYLAHLLAAQGKTPPARH